MIYMEVELMTFSYRYRKQIIISFFCFLLITALVTSFFIFFKNKEKTKKDNDSLIKKNNSDVILEKSEKEQSSEELYRVDIKGCVVSPGIYSLKKESRVIDVINMAGGLREDANTTVINLSKKITDEMVIIIYSNQEVSDFSHTKELENTVIDRCIQKDENSLKNDACISMDTTSKDTVNNLLISINTATKEELMSLSGIGEKKAEDIIQYREKNGGFKSIDELKNVEGIGDSLFDKIKENITL